MNTKYLLIILFYILLVTSSFAKKKTLSKLNTQTVISSPTDITSYNGGSPCFYGAINDLNSVMQDNVDSYSDEIDFILDTDLSELNDFVVEVANLEAEAINETLNVSNTAVYALNIGIFASQYPALSFYNYISTFYTLSKATQLSLIANLWDILVDIVNEISALKPRPVYFAADYYRYSQYNRQLIKWQQIYTNFGICYPTDKYSNIYTYDELTNDLNSETFYYTRPGDSFTISDEDLIKEGGIAIAFWSKISLEDCRYTARVIFDITKGSNQIKLYTELGLDGISVDIKLLIGTKLYVINNNSPCTDITFNTLIIQKEIESLNLSILIQELF